MAKTSVYNADGLACIQKVFHNYGQDQG